MLHLHAQCEERGDLLLEWHVEPECWDSGSLAEAGQSASKQLRQAAMPFSRHRQQLSSNNKEICLPLPCASGLSGFTAQRCPHYTSQHKPRCARRHRTVQPTRMLAHRCQSRSSALARQNLAPCSPRDPQLLQSLRFPSVCSAS